MTESGCLERPVIYHDGVGRLDLRSVSVIGASGLDPSGPITILLSVVQVLSMEGWVGALGQGHVDPQWPRRSITGAVDSLLTDALK